eukprot:g10874.t1
MRVRAELRPLAASPEPEPSPDTRTKRVVFVRHGESLANVIRKKYEAAPPVDWKEYSSLPLGDVPLTDTGIAQAVATGERMRGGAWRSYLGLGPSQASDPRAYRIWSSPLRRAIETTQCLFGGRLLRKEVRATTASTSACATTSAALSSCQQGSTPPAPHEELLRIDRIEPSLREFFPDDFARGADCSTVSTEYLGYAWGNEEWDASFDSVAHICDAQRMEKLHELIVEELFRPGAPAGGRGCSGNTIGAESEISGLSTEVDTIFLVCHWGTILNYIQRFCDNLERTEDIARYKQHLGAGWEGIDMVDPTHMDLENCAVRVVEYNLVTSTSNTTKSSDRSLL